jgi:hypothetical protein
MYINKTCGREELNKCLTNWYIFAYHEIAFAKFGK